MQKLPYIFLITACLVSSITMNAPGAIHTRTNSATNSQVDTDNMGKDEIIATLKNDIKAIDEQMAQCKRQKNGWTAATVIGSAGIVGTGISAIVQNNQIQSKKADLKSTQDELRYLQ